MTRKKEVLNYALAILFGIATGLIIVTIVSLMATPKHETAEPPCAIERNTVVYPDGEDAEAKITNECLVRAKE